MVEKTVLNLQLQCSLLRLSTGAVISPIDTIDELSTQVESVGLILLGQHKPEGVKAVVGLSGLSQKLRTDAIRKRFYGQLRNCSLMVLACADGQQEQLNDGSLGDQVQAFARQLNPLLVGVEMYQTGVGLRGALFRKISFNPRLKIDRTMGEVVMVGIDSEPLTPTRVRKEIDLLLNNPELQNADELKEIIRRLGSLA